MFTFQANHDKNEQVVIPETGEQGIVTDISFPEGSAGKPLYTVEVTIPATTKTETSGLDG